MSNLEELESIPSSFERIVRAARALEGALRRHHGLSETDKDGPTLGQLVGRTHEFEADGILGDVFFAIGVRNRLAHPGEEPTDAEMERAANYLLEAVRSVRTRSAVVDDFDDGLWDQEPQSCHQVVEESPHPPQSTPAAPFYPTDEIDTRLSERARVVLGVAGYSMLWVLVTGVMFGYVLRGADLSMWPAIGATVLFFVGFSFGLGVAIHYDGLFGASGLVIMAYSFGLVGAYIRIMEWAERFAPPTPP